MHRFGEHRLTYEERRVQLLDSLGFPTGMLFRPVEKSDQRSRINDGGAHRDRNPRDARGSKRGPGRQNRLLRGGPSSGWGDPYADAFRAELQAPAAIPPQARP